MARPTNSIKAPETEKRTRPDLKAGVGGAVQNVLGGNFLTKERAVRLLPFFLFRTMLTMCYIANTYVAEKTERDIQSLRKSLKELRYE